MVLNASELEESVRRCCRILEDAGGSPPAIVKTWLDACRHVASALQAVGEQPQAILVAIEVLASILQAATTATEDLIKQVRVSEGVNAQLMVSVTELEQGLEQSRQEYSTVAHAREAELLRNAALQETIQRQKEDLVAMQRLRTETAELKAAHAKVLNESLHRSADLEDAASRGSDLAETVDQLKEDNETLKVEKNKAERKCKELREEVSMVSEREEMVRHELFENREELQRYKKHYVAVVIKGNDLQQQVDGLEAEKISRHAEVASARTSTGVVELHTQATQTNEPTKEQSLAITRTLFKVEKLCTEMSSSTDTLRRANAKLDMASLQSNQQPMAGLPQAMGNTALQSSSSGAATGPRYSSHLPKVVENGEQRFQTAASPPMLRFATKLEREPRHFDSGLGSAAGSVSSRLPPERAQRGAGSVRHGLSSYGIHSRAISQSKYGYAATAAGGPAPYHDEQQYLQQQEQREQRRSHGQSAMDLSPDAEQQAWPRPAPAPASGAGGYYATDSDDLEYASVLYPPQSP